MTATPMPIAEVPKPTPQPQRSLIRKLSEIMGEVDRVPKAGRNDFHKYDYATEADIAAAVRSAMAKRGVMLIPSVQKTDWSELPTKNGKMRLCTLTVLFTLHDGDSGETLEYVVLGEGSDSGDKATYKALTGAEKYALLKIFLIPTGDDPERDDRPAPQPHPTPASGTGKRTAELKARLSRQQAAEVPIEALDENGEVPPDYVPPPTDDDAPPDSRPTRQIEARPATSKGSAVVPKYGNAAKTGTPLGRLTDKDLGWYLMTARENVEKEDPRWHAKNVEFLAAVQAEVDRRR